MNKPPPYNSLPLSWQYSTRSFRLTEIPLLTKRQVWLTSAKCNFEGIDKLINYRTSASHSGFVIRGCNAALAGMLQNNGCDKILFGKEAVLRFDEEHFQKASLKELIRRGMRHGYATEVPRSPETMDKLNELIHKAKHSREPQLKHLFITEFIEGTRLFVFRATDGQWLGAVLISENSAAKYHTELLLRRMDAPVGIMEALICHTFNVLIKDGKEEFSLGEVPFIVTLPLTKKFYRDFFLNRIARLIRFAYNYEGLYNFKNKFSPRWDDVYICGCPKLKLTHITGIVFRSNLFRLILYKALRIIN